MNNLLYKERKLTMTRKAFLIVCLCIVSICCVYAGKVGFVAQGSPFSVQTVAGTSGKYVSTYGYGFKAGVRYEIVEHFTIGLDAGESMFKFKELGTDYLVIAVRAVAGYTYNFNEKLFANAELGAGISLRSIGSKSQTSFGMNAYIGAGYRLSSEFALTLGGDFDLGFQNGLKSKSTDFAFKTELGLVLSL